MKKHRWLQKSFTSLFRPLVFSVLVVCWVYVLLAAILTENDNVVPPGEGWKYPYRNVSQLRFTRRLHEKYHKAQYKLYYSGMDTCPLPCEEKVCYLSVRGYPSTTGAPHGFIDVSGKTVHTWSTPTPSIHLVKLTGGCQPKEVKSLTDPKLADHYTSQEVTRGDVLLGATSGNNSAFTSVLLRLCIGSDLKAELLKELGARDTWAFLYTPGRRGETKCWVWQNGTESTVWSTRYSFGKEFIIPHKKGTVNLDVVERMHSHVEHGGRWRPQTCHPRSKIALIIPYRDRLDHLKLFLANIHKFLQAQQLDYTIVVVEQADSHPFNRAALLNVGYLEMSSMDHFDCFVFHDVDLIPEDLCNLYYCGTQPRLLCVARNSYRYRVAYWHYFGGAVILNQEHMDRISGFPTNFYGWGGEDDEIWMRLRVHNMHPARYAPEVSTYYQLEHETHKERIDKWLEIFDHARYTDDGLPTTRYKLLSLTKLPLYTHIKVELPPPHR